MEDQSKKNQEDFIIFKCPKCNIPLRAPKNSIGKKAKCLGCDRIFELTKELLVKNNIEK